MTVIAFIGWVVNFHSSTYFKSNAQVSNTLGALAIGIAANACDLKSSRFANFSIDVHTGHVPLRQRSNAPSMIPHTAPVGLHRAQVP
jgi:hypothetical protein